MVKLRTLKECYEYIKENDERSAVTPYFLRQMVVQKRIPYMRSGRKYLINLDNIEKFMAGELPLKKNETEEDD